jgi:hypothetical protein
LFFYLCLDAGLISALGQVSFADLAGAVSTCVRDDERKNAGLGEGYFERGESREKFGATCVFHARKVRRPWV